MEKINLNVLRGGSDSIVTTFAFIKQEFVPFIKSLVVIVLPLIALDFLVKSFFLDMVLSDIAAADPIENLMNKLTEYLGAFLVYMWLQIMVINYIKVYREKFRNNDRSPITPSEVWKAMRSRLWSSLLVFVIIGVATFVGLIFFIIPGIYLSVAFAFALYWLILKEESINQCLEKSMELVKGRWWRVFLYSVLLYLIAWILTIVFSVPYLIIEIMRTLTGEAMNYYGAAAGYYFASLGQYLLISVVSVGMGIRFLGYLEQLNHETLLDKIAKMGQNLPEGNQEDEGER